ncbi:hypothetical protein ACMHYO_11545 [Allopusillimonas ginsengisoli]|uniref:hypothetical protein n=1 Tax=Allopusillimonas ginsengisoli TaxID=453575 RepID=UPI0039C4661B
MSRHIFSTEHQGRPVVVVIGWDRPLQYHFMTIQRMDAAEDEPDFLYSNLDEPNGTSLSLPYYRGALEQLGIAVPESMFREAEADSVNNVGNRFVSHDANGTMDEPGAQCANRLRVGDVVSLESLSREQKALLDENGFGTVKIGDQWVNVVRYYPSCGGAEYRVSSFE